MILRILFIVALFSLASCSVTKRVHRNGFHVTWNNNFSKNVEQNNDQGVVESERLNSDTLLIVTSEIYHDQKIERIKVLNVEDVTSIKDILNKKKLSRDESEILIRDVVFDNYLFKDVGTLEEEDVSEAEFESLEIIGIVLLCLGTLFLLGSLILVLGFVALDGLFSALVFSGNGIVVGVFGFVLFLILLLIAVLFMFIIQAMGGFSVGFILGGIMIGSGFILLLLNSSKNS